MLAVALLCSIGTRTGSATAVQARQAGPEAAFFKSKILPILTARCQSCHNHTLKLSGLSLESAAVDGARVERTGPWSSRATRSKAACIAEWHEWRSRSCRWRETALPEAEVTLLKTLD